MRQFLQANFSYAGLTEPAVCGGQILEQEDIGVFARERHYTSSHARLYVRLRTGGL